MRTVTKVIYGDTLQLDGGETVRLIGVQAPKYKPEDLGSDGQPKDPNSASSSWVRRSREFTQGLVSGRQVWLEDVGAGTDENGAKWVYLYFKLDSAQSLGGGGLKPLLSSGTYMVNRLVIQYGFATSGSPFSFQYRSQFKQMENDARRQQIGLWQTNF